MAQSDRQDVLPQELGALDELARLLEQYQTYLIAGHGFADAARAQASNASGTARPTLERLHPNGAAGGALLEAALRAPRTEEDRRIVLEEVGAALKDLRAIIATARWRAATTFESPVMPAQPPRAAPLDPVVLDPAVPTAAARSRVWLWIGGGVVLGLILGAFGTELPRSAGALSRLWTMLQPVLAAGMGGVLGGLLLQNGKNFKATLRNHWLALIVSSVLLMSTAPTTVDAVHDMFDAGQRKPVGTVDHTPGPGASQPPASTPPDRAPAPTSDVAPPAAPGSTIDSSSAPTPTPPSSSDPSSTGGAAAPAAQSSSPAANRGSSQPATKARSDRMSAECTRLLEKALLDELTGAEKRFMQLQCGK